MTPNSVVFFFFLSSVDWALGGKVQVESAVVSVQHDQCNNSCAIVFVQEYQSNSIAALVPAR